LITGTPADDRITHVNLYCVRLTAIKPGTTQRQKLIVNQVPAIDEQMASYEAIKNVTKNDPRISDEQPEPEPETVPSWVAWALMMALSLLLTAAALAFTVYLPAMWRVLS
jgi:hypothetical protein